jgi:ribonuclease E
MTESMMLLNASDREETRIAVVEDGRLDGFYVERSSRETLLGNIYLGRVEGVHPGLQAAFVNLGLERNGFLHWTEARYAEFDPNDPPQGSGAHPARLIEKIVRPGQSLLVQVTRDAFGQKGPSLTTHLAVAGKSLVMTPNVREVVASPRIVSGQVAQRIKRVVEQWVARKRQRGYPGFMIKTSATSASERDLKADLEYLDRIWAAVRTRLRGCTAPASVYKEPGLVIRAVRDYYHKNIKQIVVDGPAVHQRLVDYFESVMPHYRERIKLHSERTPLFHHYGVERQIDELGDQEVRLPLGGRLIIEQTEALTAIDVNSGTLRETDPEKLALRTNLDAVPEIMRQLRLRDLGGIIVIDFIDLRQKRHVEEVERAVEREAAKDPAQLSIERMSRFCLMEIARQKMRPSLQLISQEPCAACGGIGFVKNTESMGLELLRALKSHLENPDIAVVEMRSHPDVVEFLKGKMEDFERIEDRYGKKVHIFPVKELPVNRAELYCYDHMGEKVVDLVR